MAAGPKRDKQFADRQLEEAALEPAWHQRDQVGDHEIARRARFGQVKAAAAWRTRISQRTPVAQSQCRPARFIGYSRTACPINSTLNGDVAKQHNVVIWRYYTLNGVLPDPTLNAGLSCEAPLRRIPVHPGLSIRPGVADGCKRER